MICSICLAVMRLAVHHISVPLMIVQAAGAESASTWTMRFSAQRVRTGTRAARDVQPLAPLYGPSESARSQGEAHGAWHTSSGVSHPEPWGCLHGLSPPKGSGSPPLPCATAPTVQIPCHLQHPLDGQAAVTMRCPMAARVTPFRGAGGVPGEPFAPGRLSWGIISA